MKSWDDLRVFLVVARLRSFSAAASRLHLNQSTVSRRISELEKRVGGPLFSRSARSFEMTELGRRLLPEAERVEDAVKGWTREAASRDRPVGEVRVATAEELASALLVPALEDLWKGHPGLDVVLDGRSAVVPVGPEAAQVALRGVRPLSGDLVFRRVATLRYRAFVSRGYLHALQEGPREDLDWLTLHPSSAPPPHTAWLEKTLRGRRPRLRTNNTLDLANAVSRDLGAALLPEGLAALYENLVALTDDDGRPNFEQPLWLVTHRALVDVARVRAVMEWVTNTCARLNRRPSGES